MTCVSYSFFPLVKFIYLVKSYLKSLKNPERINMLLFLVFMFILGSFAQEVVNSIMIGLQTRFDVTKSAQSSDFR